MKILAGLLLSLLLISCSGSSESTKIDSSSSFFVGTYTNGNSEGIYKYEISPEGKLSNLGIVAKTENPSFLTKSADGQFLLSVSEVKNEDGSGSVESYKILDEGLKFLSRSSSGGAHPCFVSTNKGGYVLAANYTGGNVGLLKMDENGILSSLLDVQQHTGQGTTNRQKKPHAHSAYFNPHENEVLAVDLGTNEVWFSTVDYSSGKLVPSSQAKIKMAPGAGPRHLAIHPNNPWVYVVNELESNVSILKRNQQDKYTIITTLSTLPEGFENDNTCADIHISNDGQFLYASNRGHNSIAIFSIDNGGNMVLLGHESTRGETPRNFSLSNTGKFLLVANQNSNNIVSFLRDENSGLLTYADEIEAFKPVCIIF
jgi:6-phosphogluconolactonase